MRPATLLGLAASLLPLAALPARAASVRAILLQGDPAPGVPSATISGAFSTAWPLPVCDATGHFAGLAMTSTGVTGLWSDDLGAIAPVALAGQAAPWQPGTATLALPFAQPILGDDGFVLFGSATAPPLSQPGLWIQNGSGLSLVAGNGVAAPGAPGPATYTVGLGPTWCLNRGGSAALDAGSAIWSFDPPPSINAYNVAAAGGSPDGFTNFESINYTPARTFGLYLVYHVGGNGVRWLAAGSAGALQAVLANGDLAPPSGSSIPLTSNITNLEISGTPSDINAANAQVFTSQIVNGGVTAANDEVIWLHDATGFHVILREGDTLPELLPGETLAPRFGFARQPELVSDAGNAVVEADVMPSVTPVLLECRSDHSVHVLARDMDPAPGLPGRLLGINGPNSSTGQFTQYALNGAGQTLLQCYTRSAADPGNAALSAAEIYMTDATGSLVPVLRDGDTVTVRPGLTGAIHFMTPGAISPLAALGLPYPSGGSDGRPRDFSDHGEYVFRGELVQVGTQQAYLGYFAVQGPDLGAVAVGPSPLGSIRALGVSPNPLSSRAAVSFTLTRPARVRLEVLDLAGRRVRTIAEGAFAAGAHVAPWDGAGDAGRVLAPGVYFVRLTGPGVSQARKVVRL